MGQMHLLIISFIENSFGIKKYISIFSQMNVESETTLAKCIIMYDQIIVK